MLSIRELRRRLASRPGLVTAELVPPASQGREQEACITPAALIEAGPVRSVAVGAPEAWPGTVAFLDGTQRVEVVAYAGASPLIGAHIAAAVRERTQREFRTVQSARRSLLLGRPEVLAQVGPLPSDIEKIALPADAPTHPLRDIETARHEVDRARVALERRMGDAYRKAAPHWLVVDGTLSDTPAWASDARMVGVAKSHATLPFAGPDLVTYLHLAEGHRSSIFQPASRREAPVYAWGLRLWSWTGRDVLYGLVRVEARAHADTLAFADTLSRWILAERAPISAPDGRWDRLLYGIRGVEDYLRAVNGDR